MESGVFSLGVIFAWRFFLRRGGSLWFYGSTGLRFYDVEVLSTALRFYNVRAIRVEVHSTVLRRGGSQDLNESKRKFPY